ncbi:hypothetical protein N5P32_12905 [Marinomonas pontica]|uniref:hypothetical protein n=1 Tax=Marinomonas pontica TaxID=264739 RepID=UPI002244CF53|nr:hypothetical protein [Marinomonas pontica]MCW8356744.1 hypothetical protein [Marinomonas pontica]
MVYFQFCAVLGLLVLFISGYLQGSVSPYFALAGILLSGCLLVLHWRLSNVKSANQDVENGSEHMSSALTDVSKSVTHATSKMAMGAAEVSHFVDTLMQDIHLTRDDSQQISKAVEMLSETGLTLSTNLGQLAHTMTETAQSEPHSSKCIDTERGSNT